MFDEMIRRDLNESQKISIWIQGAKVDKNGNVYRTFQPYYPLKLILDFSGVFVIWVWRGSTVKREKICYF